MSSSDPVPTGLRGGIVAIAVFLAVFAVGTDSADAEEPAEVPEVSHLEDAPAPFNGAFGEWSARAAVAVPSDGMGWMGDIGFRTALPMYVGDSRLAYSYGRWSVSDHTVGVHGTHATVGLHPFFLSLLSKGVISHFLASLHLELGAGAQWACLTETDDSRGGVTGSLGVGFDLPLTNPNDGRALWLNTVYRRNWSSIDFELDGQTHQLHTHQFFVGLGWRTNGTIW